MPLPCKLCALVALMLLDVFAGAQAPATARPSLFSRSFDCDGIAIRSTASVKEETVQAACGLVRKVFEHLPQLRANLSLEGAEVELAAKEDSLSRIPWVAVTKHSFTNSFLAAACSEEGILDVQLHPEHTDRCVQSIARMVDAGLGSGVRLEIYDQMLKARTDKLWLRAFVPLDYWPELSAWYFGGKGDEPEDHPLAPGPDALKAYNPKGFALLDKIYKGKEQPTGVALMPAQRLSSADGVGHGEHNTYHRMLVINDSKQTYAITKVTMLASTAYLDKHNSFTADSQFSVPAYSREMINALSGDVFIVVDAAGHEVGRYGIVGETSVIDLNTK